MKSQLKASPLYAECPYKHLEDNEKYRFLSICLSAVSYNNRINSSCALIIGELSQLRGAKHPFSQYLICPLQDIFLII